MSKSFFVVVVAGALFSGANAQILSEVDAPGLFGVDAQSEENSQIHFELFNNCKPVVSTIWVGQEKGKNGRIFPELAEQAVQDVVELRLRSAGIYGGNRVVPASPEKGNGLLSIIVHTIGQAFSITVQFSRVVIESTTTGQIGVAITWQGGTFGTHGGNRYFILDALREEIDEFTLAYLRANEGACK